MNIGLLSFSSSGGAGKVTRLLAEGLGEIGYKTEVYFPSSSDIRSEPLRNLGLTVNVAYDNYLVRSKKWKSNVSMNRFLVSEDIPHSMFETDALIIRWSVGLFGFDSSLFTRKVIWTLPDEAWFTGACHNSVGCEGATTGCIDCPAVRSVFSKTVQKRIEQKKAFFDSINDLTFVAHSEHMMEKFSRSSVGHGRNVVKIANPIDDVFTTAPEKKRKPLSAPVKIVTVAQSLDDPIKGFWDVAGKLDSLAEKGHVQLTAVGGHSKELSSRYRHINFVGPKSAQFISNALDRNHLLLTSSYAEGAGNVIFEAAARGVPSLVRLGSGPDKEIFEKGSGFVFRDSFHLEETLSLIRPKQIEDMSLNAISTSLERSKLKVSQEYSQLIG